MPLTNTEVDAAVPFGAGEQPDRALTNAALKELIVDIAAKAITVQDEGVSLATSADTLNFVGAGVSATGTGATKTITIAGGGDVATDAIWDAAGDLAVGSGANTAARLAIGAEGTYLGVVGGALAYSTPAGSGDVTKVGTPLNNQMPVWTGDGTLEGTSDFTYDGTSLNLVTGKNFQIAGGTVLSDAAGTLTLSGIDALDPTTEATVEAAIDTLANLTSVQGRTVTLADAGADAVFGWDDSASAYQNLSAADARSALELTSLATLTPASGVAAWIADPSSSNLRAAVTDEDGDGALLFANASVELTGATNLVRATHGNRVVILNAGSPFTVTIEDDTTGDWGDSNAMTFVNIGAGTVTIAGDGTSVVTSVPGYALTIPQNSIGGAQRSGTNAWSAYGQLAVTVSGGGTGVASLTAYAPVFGGTTSTGAVQSGTVGTSGQVLTSNGAGALPTFQDAAGSAEGMPRAISHRHYAIVQQGGTSPVSVPASTTAGLIGTLVAATGLYNTDYAVVRSVLTASNATVNSGQVCLRGQASASVMAPGAVDVSRVVWEGVFFPCDSADGRRCAAGMWVSTDLTGTPTIDPDAFLNCALFGKRAADSNLHLITNDGSGTGTSADLGANFPAAGTSDYYYGRLELRGGATRTLYYYIKNMVSGNSTSGSTTTTIPDAAAMLTYMDYVNNGPTTATAATKPFSQGCIYTYQTNVAS